MPDHDWFDGDDYCSCPRLRDDPKGVRAYAYLAVSSVPRHSVVPNDFVKRNSARDDEFAATVLEHYPGDVDAWVLVRLKLRAWLKYWAVNHPTEAGRERCVAALKEGDGLIEWSRPFAKAGARSDDGRTSAVIVGDWHGHLSSMKERGP